MEKMAYTTSEYTDMIITFGLAQEDARVAARLYAEQFPKRDRHPDHQTILGCVQHAKEFGNVFIPDRQNAQEEGFLRNGELHRCQRVQRQLWPRDQEQRIYFCEGFLAQCRRNNFFPDKILWTDVAMFTSNNSRHRWTIHVWAGIIGNRIIGPHFLPSPQNKKTYINFLRDELPALLEDVPLQVRMDLIWQHDVLPAHSSRRIREFLNERYPDRWMGRDGPIIWPARSPDLNVLDYFLWDHLENLVEYGRDGTKAEMKKAILAAFDTIAPEMVYRATRNIIRRAELCLKERGRHFEQLFY